MRRVVEMFYFIFIILCISINYILSREAAGEGGKFDCKNITCGIRQKGEPCVGRALVQVMWADW